MRRRDALAAVAVAGSPDRGGFSGWADLAEMGDGSGDHAPAIEALLRAGKVLVGNPGRAYPCRSPVVHAGSAILIGVNLVFDHPGIGLRVRGGGGSFAALGCTFDGGGRSSSPVVIEQKEVASLRDSSVLNVYGTEGAVGLVLSSCPGFMLDNCLIRGVRALADGVIGNTAGSAVGVYVTGPSIGSIRASRFEDIHSVGAEGQVVFEDADAISCFAAPGVVQDVSIAGSRFSNLDKRWAKFSGQSECHYAFESNRGSSPWTGTPDDEGTTGNGMIAPVSLYGGSLEMRRNALKGGVCQCLLDVQGENAR